MKNEFVLYLNNQRITKRKSISTLIRSWNKKIKLHIAFKYRK